MKTFTITLLGMCTICYLAELPIVLGVATTIVFYRLNEKRCNYSK